MRMQIPGNRTVFTAHNRFEQCNQRLIHHISSRTISSSIQQHHPHHPQAQLRSLRRKTRMRPTVHGRNCGVLSPALHQQSWCGWGVRRPAPASPRRHLRLLRCCRRRSARRSCASGARSLSRRADLCHSYAMRIRTHALTSHSNAQPAQTRVM
jgi:hypothetical protein